MGNNFREGYLQELMRKPCKKCGVVDRYASGSCKPCTRFRHARRNEVDLTRTRISFEPIFRKCEERRARTKMYQPWSPDEVHLPWVIPDEYRKMYDNSIKSGRISVLDADAFCCDVLQVHPIQVYGPEFLTVGEKVA